MRDYNDFPILTEEQYKSLNDIYEQSNQSLNTDIENVMSQLKYISDSFIKIKTKTNKELKQQISIWINDLSKVLSSIELLYPNLNNNNQENSTDNIFLTLHYISNVILNLDILIKNEKKLYYKKSLMKFRDTLLVTLTNIHLTYSKLNTRFF